MELIFEIKSSNALPELPPQTGSEDANDIRKLVLFRRATSPFEKSRISVIHYFFATQSNLPMRGADTK